MNMSYCRWQNTLADFRDCYNAATFEDCLDPDSDLSQDERHAAGKLLTLAKKLVEAHSDLLPTPPPPTEPGSLLDTLANVTAALDNVLLHQGKHMTPADLYQRQMLCAATKHTLTQHGIKL